MPHHEPREYESAVDFLVRLKSEPYWDSSATRGQEVLFRKIRGTEVYVYRWTRQRQKLARAKLVPLLGLKRSENVAEVRKEVLRRLNKDAVTS